MHEPTPPSTVAAERWAAAILEVRSVLINRIVTLAEPDVTYGELSKQVAQDLLRNTKGGFDQLKARWLLGDISSVEHEQGRPMLTVLVVSEKNRTPGNGFFGLARKLERLFEDEEQFLRDERKRVIDYWRAHA